MRLLAELVRKAHPGYPLLLPPQEKCSLLCNIKLYAYLVCACTVFSIAVQLCLLEIGAVEARCFALSLRILVNLTSPSATFSTKALQARRSLIPKPLSVFSACDIAIISSVAEL